MTELKEQKIADITDTDRGPQSKDLNNPFGQNAEQYACDETGDYVHKFS